MIVITVLINPKWEILYTRIFTSKSFKDETAYCFENYHNSFSFCCTNINLKCMLSAGHCSVTIVAILCAKVITILCFTSSEVF